MTKETKKITTSEALEFAKKEIIDNEDKSKAVFAIKFIETFLEGLKTSGQDKDKEPTDYMMNGIIVGYAMRYMEDKGE